MNKKKQLSFTEIKQSSNGLGMLLNKFEDDRFAVGLNIPVGNGRKDPDANVAFEGPKAIGKIALAHLHKNPDSCSQLPVFGE